MRRLEAPGAGWLASDRLPPTPPLLEKRSEATRAPGCESCDCDFAFELRIRERLDRFHGTFQRTPRTLVEHTVRMSCHGTSNSSEEASRLPGEKVLTFDGEPTVRPTLGASRSDPSEWR